MFSLFKNTLSKIYQNFTAKVHSLFTRSHIDEETLKELEILLISADAGVKTTKIILANLREQVNKGTVAKGDDLKQALERQLITLLQAPQVPAGCSVFLLIGVNGTGKTTFAGKLAHHYSQQGKKVLLVAADTFRAAATQQLEQWAARSGTAIVVGSPGQDPAAVVFNACEKFKNEQYDILIIDTAGRLQTKVNLMKELEKIKRVTTKQLPSHTVCTFLTIDAMLGQNSLEQAKLFHQSTTIDGIVLTKIDGTGKGGIVFAIVQELHVPIVYLSFGEGIGNLKLFDPQEYVSQLLES